MRQNRSVTRGVIDCGRRSSRSGRYFGCLTISTWDKATAERNGGNSDGIAALVGALLGATFGAKAMLAAWPDVESAQLILNHARTLWRAFFCTCGGVSGGEKTDESGRLEIRVLVREDAGMLCGLDQTKGYCFRG
jgi:hypothetical protein